MDEFRAAVRPANSEYVVTGAGAFAASIVRIDLHQLRLQRFHETLARTWRIEMSEARVAMGFYAEPGAPMKRQGIELMPDEIGILSSAGGVCHTAAGPCHLATMSLPATGLAELSVAVAGLDVTPTDPVMTANVTAASMTRLGFLHRAAAQLAETSPDIITRPEAARGLEASLGEALVICLAAGRLRTDTASQRRHALLIKRFRALEEANRGRALYLPEVCAALGVSQRTLHQVCHEQLGIGPKRYLLLRRLHLAHRDLRSATPSDGTVTDIATKYGFWELGRFAVSYRTIFGQSPSVTLRESLSRWHSGTHWLPRIADIPPLVPPDDARLAAVNIA
ncbi:MAG TPA: helix-turn-helix domain-containing protein [Rhodopila sp.]|nr:helix-turn-helix domain-containing protein [Rhodopila sp.]